MGPRRTGLKKGFPSLACFKPTICGTRLFIILKQFYFCFGLKQVVNCIVSFLDICKLVLILSPTFLSAFYLSSSWALMTLMMVSALFMSESFLAEYISSALTFER